MDYSAQSVYLFLAIPKSVADNSNSLSFHGRLRFYCNHRIRSNFFFRQEKQVNRNLSSSRSVKKGIAPNVTVSSKTTPTSNTIIKAIPVDGSPINKIQNEDAVSHSTVNTVMNILNKSNLNSNAVKPILEIDDSIIDVTNEVYKISSEKLPTEPKINVVPWLHRYIYSYSDLESATEDQRKFYVSFRYYFLKGKCLDLEGNDNYAFVLLFHLFKDYDQHGSIEKLKDDLYILSEKYPKTKPYCSSLLAKVGACHN